MAVLEKETGVYTLYEVLDKRGRMVKIDHGTRSHCARIMNIRNVSRGKNVVALRIYRSGRLVSGVGWRT